MTDNNLQAYYEILRAGLWKQNALLSNFEFVDYDELYRLSEEQTILGIMTAGLANVKDVKIPQDVLLDFVGISLQLEYENIAMNKYIVELQRELRAVGIYSILLKGQGIAQCYDQPLWRKAGDIDLLLDEEGFEKAKRLLLPRAQHVEKNYDFFKHIEIFLDGWCVELHGTLHGRLSKRIDNILDEIQKKMLTKGVNRVWNDDDTDVYLPKPDDDAIFVFCHILHHFFFEGVGLRQICDWCRLLWTYHDEIDVELLEHRLRAMALMTEWRSFSAYAVEWLGMPTEAMPLYVENLHWSKKAEKISYIVLKTGNFGYNQVRNSFCQKYSLLRKCESLWIRLGLLFRHFSIFPIDSVLFFIQVIKSAFKQHMEQQK